MLFADVAQEQCLEKIIKEFMMPNIKNDQRQGLNPIVFILQYTQYRYVHKVGLYAHECCE
jgi:hypothetical protein